MFLAGIISSLANGNSALTGKFVAAKALWATITKDLVLDDAMALQQLTIDIANEQDKFEAIGGSDHDVGKTLMGLTCLLPFYDEVDGIYDDNVAKARAVLKAILASNVSGEVKVQARQSAEIFGLNLDH